MPVLTSINSMVRFLDHGPTLPEIDYGLLAYRSPVIVTIRGIIITTRGINLERTTLLHVFFLAS